MTDKLCPATRERPDRYDLIAQRFHEVYEELAPLYRWETQKRSRVPWADLPAEQRGLMRETVKRVLDEEELTKPVSCGMVDKEACGDGKRRSPDCPFVHSAIQAHSDDARDAARYRHLREQDDFTYWLLDELQRCGYVELSFWQEHLDQAIDKDMATRRADSDGVHK